MCFVTVGAKMTFYMCGYCVCAYQQDFILAGADQSMSLTGIPRQLLHI